MVSRKWVLLSSCAILVVAVAIGVLSRTDIARGKTIGKTIVKADPVADLTRLQLDAFELTCTHQNLARFDLDAIGAGRPAAEEVLQRLGQLGTARLMLHYDNVVDLGQVTKVGTGMHVPVVSNLSISSGGVITPSVDYHRVGFVGTISGVWLDDDDPMQARVAFQIECSDLLKDSMRITEQVGVPMLAQRLSTEVTRVLRSAEPIWLACNDLRLAAETEDETKMTVIRLTATRLTD